MEAFILVLLAFWIGWWAGGNDVENTTNPLIEECQKELPRDVKCILFAKPEVTQ